MCGIVGFNWKDDLLLGKLSDLLRHRGPDGEGLYSDSDVSLGHRRLAILDLSVNGKQPMTDESGNYWIIYNGEIFNFRDIRRDLESKGYRFHSETDTEVLLYGYIEYGSEILKKLDGQFAFCIYDKKKKALFIARDRLGINPLYYFNKDGRFVFGSELKVIMESGVEKRINRFALNYYLLYGHTPQEQSILCDAYKLLPGHFLVFDLKRNEIVEKTKYWSLTFDRKINKENEADSLLVRQFRSSVESRLISDVPVGAFLSGGVDSSAVVAFISEHKDNLNTFSIKFDKKDFDESKYAKIVSDKYSTNHFQIEFSAQDVEDLLPLLAYHYDEPFSDPSMISTYLVSKVAREHVTVSLSGDGGDELFGGYKSYRYYRMLSISRFIPRPILELAYKAMKTVRSERLLKFKSFFEIGRLERSRQYAALMGRMNSEEFSSLTGEQPGKYYDAYASDYLKGDFMSEATRVDIHNYLCENNLTKIDRASMANSLESRPPFLDHRMVELAVSMDSRLKFKSNELKYILKKSMEPFLPKSILYRKKQGFDVPLKHYFRSELRHVVDKYFLNYKGHGFFNREFINSFGKKLSSKSWQRDYSRTIWSIIFFNIWWERWMK